VAPGDRAGELQGHLDRFRAAGREQDLARAAVCDRGEICGKLNRRPVGEAPGRPHRGDQSRVTVADMVDVVAVKVHVTAAREVFQPDSFGPAERREAWRRQGLVQEVAGVRLDQRTHRRRQPVDKGPSAWRVVGVAFPRRRRPAKMGEEQRP
jgi:hypothetical protein